jgi:hypothetical protein
MEFGDVPNKKEKESNNINLGRQINTQKREGWDMNSEDVG